MSTNINMQQLVEKSIEAELIRVKEELTEKYAKQIQQDLREKMAIIILKTEQYFSVVRDQNNIVITLINKVDQL
tara:strand:+ start:1721 stop:1942 length:222 start_codon:yes stop_codon:yes gene_type:complete